MESRDVTNVGSQCCFLFLVWPIFQNCFEMLPVKRKEHVNWLIFFFFPFLKYWLLEKPPLSVYFGTCVALSNPTMETSPKTKRKNQWIFFGSLERGLALQSVCLRLTSQSVLWCCSIALFTSASCSKPIWSDAHRVLTTISTSVNSLLGLSHSIWLSKRLLYSVEHRYIPVWVFKEECLR